MKNSRIVAATACLALAAFAASAEIKVLTVTGDWKSQEWYQDNWMAKPGQPSHKLYRGRYIAARVNAAAPGKFAFTDLTNYAGQEYLDANYLSQFDVVLLGDIVGWSLNPRFQAAVADYVKNGGGLIYCGSWKWHTAMVKGTPFADVLPADFPVDGIDGDWKRADTMNEPKPFKPALAAAAHPAVKGLDWASVPDLERNFRVLPKPGAEVLVKSPSGSPVLVAWQLGKGRTMITGSIFSNDELSEKFSEWRDFGKFYAQVFGWLGANSPRKAVAVKDAAAEVVVAADFARTLNAVPAAVFSVHGHDSPGFDPLLGLALENFNALNPKGTFARFSSHCAKARGEYDFAEVDKQLANIKRLGLEPLALFGAYGYGKPDWMWEGGSSWRNPSAQAIEDAKNEIHAFLEHANGKKGAPGYQTTVKYVELCNEPDINYQTAEGYARLFNAVADHVHANFPGVLIGSFGSYEVPYVKAFIDASGKHADWISRHPYGWTGERLFAVQDEFAAYAASKGHGHLKFIITEWDFWIQGRQKFDYMVKRNFEAVKRDNLLGAMHYRLGMYNEPIYLFGLLWGGWGQDRGAGAPNTPMHDAYDAFWIFRDFRGDRVAVEKTGEGLDALLPHVLADGTRQGDKLNLVLYYDWTCGGNGFEDYAAGRRYPKVKAKVALTFPAVKKDRVLTIARANGEGFDFVRKDVKIAAGATEYRGDVDLAPATAYSVAVQ